jgi:hypothetical protein
MKEILARQTEIGLEVCYNDVPGLSADIDGKIYIEEKLGFKYPPEAKGWVWCCVDSKMCYDCDTACTCEDEYGRV